jgi:hypothetical protein
MHTIMHCGLASEVMTEISSWLEISDCSRRGCVTKYNRRLCAWRQSCGIPAAEVMTRETVRKWLKTAVWDSCSRLDDTWNLQEVVEESRVTALLLLCLAYSLFLSLTLTTLAINIRQHTKTHLPALTDSSTAADCPLGTSCLEMDTVSPHTPFTPFM